MKARKVFSVYVRQNYEGPWKRIAWFADKKSANAEAQKLKFMYDETRVIAEFDYEVR